MVRVYRVLLIFLIVTVGGMAFNSWELHMQAGTVYRLTRTNGKLVLNSCKATNILTAVLPLVEATNVAEYQAAQQALRSAGVGKC
jgi:hypothetical protein